MGKVVLYMSMSVDGFIAGPDDGEEHGLGVGGELLHGWLRRRRLGPGVLPACRRGGRDRVRRDDGHRRGDHRTADVRRSRAAGRATTRRRPDLRADPRRRPRRPPPGSARYVTDIASCVAEAKAAAGDRDILLHGAATAQECLRAGLLDELELQLVPGAARAGPAAVRRPAPRRAGAGPGAGRARRAAPALPRRWRLSDGDPAGHDDVPRRLRRRPGRQRGRAHGRRRVPPVQLARPARRPGAERRGRSPRSMATRAVIAGRRTYEHAGRWQGDHHDGVPIFVLTHEVPAEPPPGCVRYVTDARECRRAGPRRRRGRRRRGAWGPARRRRSCGSGSSTSWSCTSCRCCSGRDGGCSTTCPASTSSGPAPDHGRGGGARAARDDLRYRIR